MNTINQVKSAQQLIEEWDQQGIYNGNWLLAVGFPHITTLLLGEAADRQHFLEQMLATGGKPIGLIGGAERDDGTFHFEFRLTEEYEGKQWAYEYMAAVVYNISAAFNGGMISESPADASWHYVTPHFGMDEFSDSKRHERNQSWARKKADVIAKFLRTRKTTSEPQRIPAQTVATMRESHNSVTEAPEVFSPKTLDEESIPAKPPTRTAGDLLEELKIAAQNNDGALLIIGFEQTTRLIAQCNEHKCNHYQTLTEHLDEGGDVIGIATLTYEAIDGEDSVRVDGRLIQEHMGQRWAKRYLDAITSVLTEHGPMALTIGTGEFLEAN